MAKGDIETYYEDGKWKNRPQGNSRASNTHETKSDAQSAGRDMARDRGVEHVIKKRMAPWVSEIRTLVAAILAGAKANSEVPARGNVKSTSANTLPDPPAGDRWPITW